MNRTFFVLAVLWASTALGGESAEGYPTSIVSLIVEPERFVGKRVTVFGYYGHPFLFLDKVRAGEFDHASALRVEDKSEDGEIFRDCSERYVVVDAELANEGGTYLLTKVGRIIDSKAGDDCWVP